MHHVVISAYYIKGKGVLAVVDLLKFCIFCAFGWFAVGRFLIPYLKKKLDSSNNAAESTDQDKEKEDLHETNETELLEGELIDGQIVAPPYTPNYERFVEGDFIHLLDRVIIFVLIQNDASVSVFAKALGTDYHQATKFGDFLEDAGIISPLGESTKREILVTKDQYEHILRDKLFKYREEIEKTPGKQFKVSEVTNMLHKDVDIMFSDFMEDIDTMDGPTFENWCADLLEEMGFINVEVTKKSGDQGVDVLAEKDDVRYAFQCKCHAADQGNTPIQEVYAGLRMYNRQVGVAVTNRSFTSGALELAEATGVILWDREKLKKLIVDYNFQHHQPKMR